MLYVAIPEKDKRQLERFIDLAGRLFNSPFVQNSKSVTFNLNFEVGKESEQKTEGFDELEMRSALIDIRKLIAPTDGMKFEDICRVVIKNATSAVMKEEIESWLKSYSEWMGKPNAINISTGEKIDTNAEIIKDWVYGHYLHEDEDRQKKLGKRGGIGKPMSKYVFVTVILTLPRLAHGLAKYAEEILAEEKKKA